MVRSIIISLLIHSLALVFAGDARAGNPAARKDGLTSHGGVILTGSSNVIINGMPAARKTDQVSCALSTGSPPVPHLGGQILTGSNTVFINGQPAARTGDLVGENGSTSTIATGSPTVNIGN